MRRRSALCALIALCLIAARAGAAANDCEATATKPPKPAAPLDYPEPLRERVFASHGLPQFETNADGTITRLQLDVGAIIWNWKTRPEDSSSEQWRRLPSLADTVTLQPDVEYTFDTVWISDCDDLVVDYPFKADRGLLLRVGRGDEVVFDALQEAARRLGKPLAAVVSIRTVPTPEVAATIAAPGENSTLGARPAEAARRARLLREPGGLRLPVAGR